MIVSFYRKEHVGKVTRKVAHQISGSRFACNGCMLFVDNIHEATYDRATDCWAVNGTINLFDGFEIV